MSRQSRNMIKYIAKRILLMFPILIAVLIFTWILLQNMLLTSHYLTWAMRVLFLAVIAARLEDIVNGLIFILTIITIRGIAR